ncbi:DeoR/GlpR family DNA-binding transcription regulator [Microbacterium sp. LRZ72]|uniref:DeoR/GlpR family DNA-binding transcription regulator n=1 Tax=Microbacterium sp. LRZ72 TaxID=2942481 RepID=UPI0029A3B11A|nr:DeoR/GlpR family DNA-binding transcription regulator [Microbacterium sp. LRZ72]MDX2375619.1 DeoR/GlpR family DNA-binding transcription regulator [Microbacterium sp. LRZ72]
MYATERQESIGRELSQNGRVSVVALARAFGVTTETVRRDLDALERAGALRRVHGGAVSADRGSTTETAVAERGEVRGDQKTRIAARALAAIGEGFRGSVYIDAGTTTAALARSLALHVGAAGRVDVVTHSVPIAFELGSRADIPITIIGGRVRGLTAAAVGSETVRAIEHLRPDVAFLGTNGLSAEFGLSTPDPDEAAVKRAIVGAARRVVVLADSSKVDDEFLVRFARIEDVDVVVTDAALPAELAAALHAAEVEVWTA